MDKLGFDLAVASGPFITRHFSDLTSVLISVNIASLFWRTILFVGKKPRYSFQSK